MIIFLGILLKYAAQNITNEAQQEKKITQLPRYFIKVKAAVWTHNK